jgi:hypothetical protein
MRQKALRVKIADPAAAGRTDERANGEPVA